MLKTKESKGITLIALIITIIVLLILAWVTINAISGSESAPAKANEAGQKNDIGTAKDDISLTVANAKMQGMENAYVENGVSASDAQNVVGRTVIQAVADKYATNNQIGKATIDIDVPKTNNIITDDATISVITTDFEVEGTITLQDGILNWDEIVPNTPRIKLNKNDLTLAPGGTATLSVKFKQLEETTIEWTTSDSAVATVSNGVVTIKTTANDDETAIITAKATYGNKEYTATCNVLVSQVSIPATQALINTPTMIGADVMNYTANNVSDWQVFYATENEVFIISKDILETNTAIGGTDETSNGYTNGSGDIEDGSYGQIWNDLWITACKNTTEGKSTLVNAQATAYLCDKTKWTRYVMPGMPSTTYAVGAPTIEMLIESVKYKTGLNVRENLTSNFIGYNKPFTTSLSAPYSKSFPWCIASPEKDYREYILCVNSGNVILTTYKAKGIRPLVSIPMNKVKIIGNKVKIDK